MYYPNLEDFREKAQHGNLIPVYKTMLADMETPVSAFTRLEGVTTHFCWRASKAVSTSLGIRFLAAPHRSYLGARAIWSRLMTSEPGKQSNRKPKTR